MRATDDGPTRRLAFAAVVCFALAAALGAYVATHAPPPIDVAGASLRGEAIPLAAFFTGLGRTGPLALIAALAFAAAFRFARSAVYGVTTVVVSQVLSQAAVAALKSLAHRPRPSYWLLIDERDPSYPSGHAVTSVVFFIGLALVARHGPRRAAAAVAAALCAVGIPWSRLALGAHYITDVAGGLLFGAGWLCATAAVARRFEGKPAPTPFR
jgi:membrane-associated phospholipid phosphatase